MHRHSQHRKTKMTSKLTNSTIRNEKCELICFFSVALGVLSIVSFEAVGEMLGNSENKIGLSHKSAMLNSFPPPSIFVLCFGTHKLRCTLIEFSSLSVPIE